MHFVIIDILLLLGFILSSQTSYGEENKNFNYNIDLSFTYIDIIKPSHTYFSSINRNWSLLTLTPTDQPSHGSRTLGLSKFKVSLYWQISPIAELQTTLRPDASLKRDGQNSGIEFDSRSGKVYKSLAEIYLLDNYSLSIRGSSLKFSFGVWENLIQRKMSYDPALEFGLLVLFPSKLSAIKFTWKNTAEFIPYSQNQKVLGHLIEIWGFGGHNDRGETLNTKEGKYDLAPSNKDSKYGLGIYYEYIYSENSSINAFCGVDSTNAVLLNHDTPSKVLEQVSTGIHYEYFYQIGGHYYFTDIKLPTLISFDIRYATEKWQFKDDYSQVSDRFHQSISLSMNTKLKSYLSAIAGYHTGKNKFQQNELHEGYQLDLGINYKISKELVLSVLFSNEKRYKFINGIKTGAFEYKDSNKNTLNRFALNINYNI